MKTKKISEKSINKIQSLYKQCLKTYKENEDTYGVAYENIVMPGPFADSFNVPAELLFLEICKINSKWVNSRENFNIYLLKCINEYEDFDIEFFLKYSLGKNAKYEVYVMEYFIHNKDSKGKPFPNHIDIDGVHIKWTSKKEYNEVEKRYVEAERKRRERKKEKYLSPVYYTRKLVEIRHPGCKIDVKNMHPIKIEVKASNPFQAAKYALGKLQLIEECFEISQLGNFYEHKLFASNLDKLKRQTVLLNLDSCIVCAETQIDRFMLNDCLDSKKILKKIQISNITRKECNKIIKAITINSPINKRLRDVVDDFSLANSYEDAISRCLAYWRCLEHATRLSNGMTRRQEDIIKIFGFRYSDKYWKQMGKMISRVRNNYAHKGLIEFDGGSVDYYLRWFKEYANTALWTLIYLFDYRRIWNTVEKVDKFFDYLPESTDNLELGKYLLEFKNKKLGN